MAVANSLQTTKKPAFSAVINSEGYKKLINNTLRDPKRANRFVASIVTAVSVNPALNECESASIVSAALLGETLGLSPSPQLGQFYLVPYNDKKKGTKVAQFQLGYKGYIQLAIRSGYYKHINVLAIKEGELVRYNPLDETIEVNLIEDEEIRESAKTAGYYAMFEYTNGFKKAMYWSKTKMLKHADKYSQAFSVNATEGRYPKVSYADYEAGNYDKKDEWLYSSFWYKDFDDMALKTMLRQLISKWGIMSIEMQSALEKDEAFIKEDGTPEYIDTTSTEIATDEQPSVIIDGNTGEVLGDNTEADTAAAEFFNE